MSKGHGTVMRNVLDAVTADWQAVVYLAADISGQPDSKASRAVEESVRRACKRLEEQGLVELGWVGLQSSFDRNIHGARKGAVPRRWGTDMNQTLLAVRRPGE